MSETQTPNNVALPAVPTYPDLLTRGIDQLGTFLPFELWAGERDIVTSQGTCGSQPLLQFQVVARDVNGLIVPYAVDGSNPGVATSYADGTLTASNPVAGNVFTIGNVVVTLVSGSSDSAPTPDSNNDGKFTMNVSAVAPTGGVVLDNIVAAVNANPTAFEVVAVKTAPTTATLYSLVEGTGGNSIPTTVQTGSGVSFGAATLTTGTTNTAARPRAIGFTAQAAMPGGAVMFFTGGVPNHAALVWPPEITTIDQRKAVFDGTGITVGNLL